MDTPCGRMYNLLDSVSPEFDMRCSTLPCWLHTTSADRDVARLRLALNTCRSHAAPPYYSPNFSSSLQTLWSALSNISNLALRSSCVSSFPPGDGDVAPRLIGDDVGGGGSV